MDGFSRYGGRWGLEKSSFFVITLFTSRTHILLSCLSNILCKSFVNVFSKLDVRIIKFTVFWINDELIAIAILVDHKRFIRNDLFGVFHIICCIEIIFELINYFFWTSLMTIVKDIVLVDVWIETPTLRFALSRLFIILLRRTKFDHGIILHIFEWCVISEF